jgi:hypothetical protein
MVVEHSTDACHRCGRVLQREDAEPVRHRVIGPRSRRLLFPGYCTSTCARFPENVESSHYGLRLSALVDLLGSAGRLSFSQSLVLFIQLLVGGWATAPSLPVTKPEGRIGADGPRAGGCQSAAGGIGVCKKPNPIKTIFQVKF